MNDNAIIYNNNSTLEVNQFSNIMFGQHNKSLEIRKIIDFTKLLKDDDKSIVFNPCITHYRDDLYICCYRYRRGIEDVSDFKEIAKNNYANPNHPYRTGWGALNTVDYTKFAMLKINTNKIKLVKKYNEWFNDINKPGDILPTNYNNTVYNVLVAQTITHNAIKNINMFDSRIVRSPTDIFFLVGNGHWGINPPENTMRESQQSFENRLPCPCTGIYIWPFRIEQSTLKINMLTQQPHLACADWSARTEKNWSFYVTDDNPNDNQLNIQITYQITEKFSGHEWLTMTFNTVNYTFSPCTNMVNNRVQLNVYSIRKSISFFRLIETIFGEGNFFISSTTPTIAYRNELLGVGHVKYVFNNYRNPALDYLQNSSIRQFTNTIERYIGNLHYTYIYLFFFYTLDINNRQLRRFSIFHLPSLSDFSLVFPTGLTRLENNVYGEENQYIVSFGGGGDVTCEALYVTDEQINNSLIDISSFFPFDQYNIYNNNNINTRTLHSNNNVDTLLHINQLRDRIINPIGNATINSRNLENRFSLFSFTRWENNEINKVVL